MPPLIRPILIVSLRAASIRRIISLSDDIMTVDEDRIKDIVSNLRVVAGKIVHGGDKHGLSDPIDPGSRSTLGVA